MATRAIKPKRDDSMLTGWESMPEKAPSIVLEAKATWTRFAAVVGLLFTAIGILAQLAPTRFPYVVGPGVGIGFLTLGLSLLLLHAFAEKEEQFRKVYAGFGLFLLGASALLRILPGDAGTLFLPYGVPGLGLGLLIVAAALRNETDAKWRQLLTIVLLAFTGVILAVGILFVCLYKQSYVSEGVLLMILGLFFAMVTLSQLPEKLAYPAGMALTLLGCLCLGIGLIGWLGCLLSGTTTDEFLVPAGFTMLVLGTVYLGVGLGIVSDWPLVVLTRRELAAIFFSPVAYAVLVASMIIAYFDFAWIFQPALERSRGIPEPIVSMFIGNFIPLIAEMFIVPMLTMRLLSEEKRTATLEVLLTAPVNEITVVLSKFIAVLFFYILTWFPYWVYLVSLRYVGGSEFDYRPMLSHGLVLLASGSSLLAIGLFLSSLTSNQIIAALFSFVVTMGFLTMFILKRQVDQFDKALGEVLVPFSLLHLTESASQGLVIPRYLMIHLSIAVFFLFLSVKVLESRKWK